MDKRHELMMKAMELFSVKGFHHTSVQEIAEAAGISKGAFYKHFQSKEQVFFEILKFYQTENIRMLSEAQKPAELTEQEYFINTMESQISQILANKEFFLMAFFDYPKDILKESETLLKEMRATQTAFYKRYLLAHYGPAVKAHLIDLTTILEGILNGFVAQILLQQQSIESIRLARSLVEYIDVIVSGIDQLEPLLQEQDEPPSPSAKLFEVIEMKMSRYRVSSKSGEALRMLKKEWAEIAPRPFLLEALLTYLEQETLLQPELDQLKNMMLRGV